MDARQIPVPAPVQQPAQMQLFEGDGRRPSNPWRLDRATRERGLRGVVEVRRALREAQHRADARRGRPAIPDRPPAPPRRAA